MRPLCFSKFPDGCGGCPDYREIWTGQVLILRSWRNLLHPLYGDRIIKKCLRYHKRVIDYQEAE